MFMKLLYLWLRAAGTTLATLQVVPGATWTATNTGRHMQAHGAGMIKVGSTYYMIGEDKTNGTNFQHVNCYSSKNLVEWAYVGPLLSESGSSGDLGPNRIVERPKVIYNSATSKYVLYMHIDDLTYSEAKIGVATSDSVCGSYTYLGSWQPLGFQSRDIGLFKDSDGSAYLLSEDRSNGLRIDALTPDYLNVSGTTHLFPQPGNIEAPAMWKHSEYYFLFGSHLSGWDPNDNVYTYATSLSGPWSNWTTFATVGTKTYDSQTNFILPLSDEAVYLGDRWLSRNLMASTYVWLPLTVDGINITMPDRESWVPNVCKGTWSFAPPETAPEAETQTISNGAVVLNCSGCSSGKSVGYLGGPNDGTLTFTNISSTVTTRTTIQIEFENGGKTQRLANVTVNGVTQELAFLPTANATTPGASTLHCDLVAGANEIVIQGIGDGSYAADVDRLLVPVY